jgi:hypothetical protein
VKRGDPTRKGSHPKRSDCHESKSQGITNPRAATANLVPQDHYERTESPQAFSERKRLFLRVGDEVTHQRYEEWGMGVVMEVMTSSVPGGTCLARIRFQDGQLRCFNNDLDNESCCYYFGVRRYWNPSHGVNAVRSKFFLRG